MNTVSYFELYDMEWCFPGSTRPNYGRCDFFGIYFLFLPVKCFKRLNERPPKKQTQVLCCIMLDLFYPLNNQKLTWKKPFSQHTFPPFVAFATAANNKPSYTRPCALVCVYAVMQLTKLRKTDLLVRMPEPPVFCAHSIHSFAVCSRAEWVLWQLRCWSLAVCLQQTPFWMENLATHTSQPSRKCNTTCAQTQKEVAALCAAPT